MNPTGIEPPYNPAMTGPDFKLSEGRYNAPLFFTDYLCIWPYSEHCGGEIQAHFSSAI
jgi:hypothetical protein